MRGRGEDGLLSYDKSRGEVKWWREERESREGAGGGQSWVGGNKSCFNLSERFHFIIGQEMFET